MTENRSNIKLESGTYDIIRKRLAAQADELNQRLDQLNQRRREIFGAIETQLIANDRINTDNYCIARDIVAIGDYCLFGYNVHIGLRSGIKLEDVFSCYQFNNKSFTENNLEILADDRFQKDFFNLYRYYKDAYFARFFRKGSFLYMVFHIAKEGEDFKSFKWLLRDGQLTYVDNRSDHEVRFPGQFEFKWERAHRDFQRHGAHPHVSILDRIFVETVGGDLTIKVEDNTDDGLGIYQEEVEYKDQTLDDAEYLYADLGNLIALKIRPYQEEFRYFIYNEKMQEVQRIDTLQDSGVLLPDQHGLIFANGYYLQTGTYKVFDANVKGKQFKQRIASPNGEDHLYVFYNNMHGIYVLLHYNVITQEVQTPIICNGYTLFPNGELCYFRAEEDATKHHVVQIWQTPFTLGETIIPEHSEDYLYKVGNKDMVKAMAECREILVLAGKEDTYTGLYDDLVKKSTDVIDSYYWVDKPEAFKLNEPIIELREIANTAIGELEKKRSEQKSTQQQIQIVQTKAEDLFDKARHQTFDEILDFVALLTDLRALRGEIISLKDLPYTELEVAESLELQCIEIADSLSVDCVHFLLEENALAPYVKQIDEKEAKLDNIKTAVDGKALEVEIDELSSSLELLIEIVSNLKIDDPTQTTRIIDNISTLFARINQVKAAGKKIQKELVGQEAEAEFAAQIKLLDQGIVNYLGMADSPQKTDDFLSRLMVQIEELEGKFVEFDVFVLQITEKREEVFNAFESHKNSLLEARNNRTSALQKAAERILSGIQNRAKAIKEVNEINSFFATDLMIDKVRNIIQQLEELEDSNKANAVQTQLKTIQEDALRQLRDRQDLFVDGANIIRLGKHQFSVNIQPLELTTVEENGQLHFHLTGTDFFLPINDEAFLLTKGVWSQKLPSENEQVYRAEYLAYQLWTVKEEYPEKWDALLEKVKQKAATRYREGYTKGIHDEDATKILQALLQTEQSIGLLHFLPDVRACGQLFWRRFLSEEEQSLLQSQLKSAGVVLRVFPNTHEFDYLIDDLEEVAQTFLSQTGLFPKVNSRAVANYLFKQLVNDDDFVISKPAQHLRKSFGNYLKEQKSQTLYKNSVSALESTPEEQYRLIRKWVHAFLEHLNDDSLETYWDETSVLLFFDDAKTNAVVDVETSQILTAMRGDHPMLSKGDYRFDYHSFLHRLKNYNEQVLPRYEQYLEQKRSLIDQFRKQLKLDTFQPKVLSSFVRNRLIDQVYLPIFGDNLAKQIGVAGEQTRTDRMGMLLLISPPGYGKTTLMEYIANRLGLVFMKINGPTLGHQVTSLDPDDAPNRAAAQELEKLNLALEMGNNVMLYVDDIQHCNSEFLQKFISLCDAQRKIEGVFNGETKTYDLRGKRICVVMAGNPYTESGEKFQIPDMLANRADIYNLGDIIGDSDAVFKLSYLENAMTSNSSLQKLVTKSQRDLYPMIELAKSGNQEGLTFEVNHGPEEINEYVAVLKKMIRVRDVVLKVNQAYIRSAAMAEDYRTEPAFKLQGSYRNMNKLAEKIVPIMNQKELETLIISHYEGESQTLTSDAEANFLKLKELIGTLNSEESQRWSDIKETFMKNRVFRNVNKDSPVAQVVAQMSSFTDGLDEIRKVLEKAVSSQSRGD